jgi:hypothetical protein
MIWYLRACTVGIQAGVVMLQQPCTLQGCCTSAEGGVRACDLTLSLLLLLLPPLLPPPPLPLLHCSRLTGAQVAD